MTSRILFCTIGQTAQVVTETVWALQRREPPWVPDAIHIVTTRVGLGRVRDTLQAPGGRLAPLFDGAPPPVTIHVPRRDGHADVYPPPPAAAPPAADAGALADVNSEDEAALMGDLILRLMAGFVADKETQVHLSLAGGRKTMSAHALLALTLVGRERDEASHVLVAPAEFEDHPAFWHPGQSDLLHRREELRLASRPPPSLDPRKAMVTLIPTPAPLMRYQVADAAALRSLRLKDVVDQVNLAARLKAAPQVVLDTGSNAVVACGVERVFAPKTFAIYRLLATACAESWPGVGPDGEGADHAGWLTVGHICVGLTPRGETIRSRVCAYMKAAVSASGGDPQDQRSLNDWEDVLRSGTDVGRVQLADAWFASARTRLPPTLTEQFGAPAAAVLGMTLVKTRRKLVPGEPKPLTGTTRFGLTLPPAAIEVD